MVIILIFLKHSAHRLQRSLMALETAAAIARTPIRLVFAIKTLTCVVARQA
ncbi:hypothetical protein [Nostoc sp.]|uniref:hypothetical protein n=1 Tax=Nostoc sp. TaxID=1180 RepID=UPI002FF82830